MLCVHYCTWYSGALWLLVRANNSHYSYSFHILVFGPATAKQIDRTTTTMTTTTTTTASATSTTTTTTALCSPIRPCLADLSLSKWDTGTRSLGAVVRASLCVLFDCVRVAFQPLEWVIPMQQRHLRQAKDLNLACPSGVPAWGVPALKS